MYSSTQFDEGRPAPWVTGLAAVMQAACIHCHQRLLFVYFLFSVLWLSTLRGGRSCGGRHGLDSRLVLLGLLHF